MTWFPNTALDETSFCRCDSRATPTPGKPGKKSIKQFQENLADTLETRMNIKHPLVNQTVVC